MSPLLVHFHSVFYTLYTSKLQGKSKVTNKWQKAKRKIQRKNSVDVSIEVVKPKRKFTVAPLGYETRMHT